MTSAVAAIPNVGEIVGEGRFELLAKLGEGGMSLVFRARDHDLNREVALKLLLPRYVGRPEREQRLINEAKYLRRLCGHPNIVEYIAEGRLHDREDWPWLSTEILHGTVLDWLFVQRKLQPEEVVHVAQQVAEALRACHAAGIVHRDPTPGNVFLIDDDVQTIKLFDFSHAGDLDGPKVAAGEYGRLTGIHDVPGTLGYMGPEQVSTAPADTKMDVFGFGVLLFEIVTRRNPYQHITEREAFIEAQRAGTLEAPRLHAWAYGVPDDLADLVQDCTARDAGQRPTMTEVLERLDALDLGRIAVPETLVTKAEPRERATLPFVVPQPNIEVTESIDARALVGMQASEPVVQPVEQTRVELAFARPVALRPELTVVPMAPEVEPEPEPMRAELEDMSRSDMGSHSRAWVIALLLALVVGMVLIGLAFQDDEDGNAEPIDVTEPEARQPTTPLETSDDGTSIAEPLKAVDPQPIPEPEPAIEPRQRDRDNPPVVAADPECVGVEDDAGAAAKRRDWKQVLEFTARTKCWSSKRARTLSAVTAHLNLGQWSECIAAGERSKDPKVQALVAACQDSL